MAASAAVALVFILTWLWRGTAEIPEKDEKYIGHGVSVPLYVSGSNSVGWWAMFITMLADVAAFASIVFGYFFFWTLREDFPPASIPGPGYTWPLVALALLGGAWALTIASRRWNKADNEAAFFSGVVGAVILAIAGIAALIAGPALSGMDPKGHVFSATVWLMVVWTSLHAAIGVIMLLYCAARRIAGRMTGRFDIDITNTKLFWHFTAATAAATVILIAGFPMLR